MNSQPNDSLQRLIHERFLAHAEAEQTRQDEEDLQATYTDKVEPLDWQEGESARTTRRRAAAEQRRLQRRSRR